MVKLNSKNRKKITFYKEKNLVGLTFDINYLQYRANKKLFFGSQKPTAKKIKSKF